MKLLMRLPQACGGDEPFALVDHRKPALHKAASNSACHGWKEIPRLHDEQLENGDFVFGKIGHNSCAPLYTRHAIQRRYSIQRNREKPTCPLDANTPLASSETGALTPCTPRNEYKPTICQDKAAHHHPQKEICCSISVGRGQGAFSPHSDRRRRRTRRFAKLPKYPCEVSTARVTNFVLLLRGEQHATWACCILQSSRVRRAHAPGKLSSQSPAGRPSPALPRESPAQPAPRPLPRRGAFLFSDGISCAGR